METNPDLESALALIHSLWGVVVPGAHGRLVEGVASRYPTVAPLLRSSYAEAEGELPSEDDRFLRFFLNLARFECEAARRRRLVADYDAEVAAIRASCRPVLSVVPH